MYLSAASTFKLVVTKETSVPSGFIAMLDTDSFAMIQQHTVGEPLELLAVVELIPVLGQLFFVFF